MTTTAKFKPYRVQSSQLNSLPKIEGQFIVVEDTQEIYFDKSSSERILMNSIFNENLSNKITTISSSSTNTQYPSAKAVYDLVDTKTTITIREW